MIQCDSLVKIYEMEQHKVMALEGLDLTIEDGEMMAIIGKSGSGKSTLLNIIGGLESPTAGILMVDGKDLSSYTEKRTGFIPSGQSGIRLAEECKKSFLLSYGAGKY